MTRARSFYVAVLLCLCTCARRPASIQRTEGEHPDGAHGSVPVLSGQVIASGTQLAICMTVCRTKASETMAFCLSRRSNCSDTEKRNAQAESLCAQTCLGTGSGLACSACVEELQRSQCTFAAGARCRWPEFKFKGVPFELACCAGETEKDGTSGLGGHPCPATGICDF